MSSQQLLWLQDQAEWLGSALAAALNIAVPKLRRGVLFWVNQGEARLTCYYRARCSAAYSQSCPPRLMVALKAQAAEPAAALLIGRHAALQAALHLAICKVCLQDFLSCPCSKSHGCF